MGRRASTLAPWVLFLVLAGGCSRSPTVALDLAQDLAVAERTSPVEVVLFGTPASAPFEESGFQGSLLDPAGDTYAWVRRKAEVLLQLPDVAARTAVLDAAARPEVTDRHVRVLLNGQKVAAFDLEPGRRRYRIDLPADAQRPGGNRLAFVFWEGAATDDPDAPRLAAAFYSLAVAKAGEAALEDLLGPGAPPAFSVEQGSLVQGVPGAIRYALRVPPGGGELRFTPESRAPRGVSASVSFRVTVEEQPGHEREVWSRTLAPSATPSSEVSIPLPFPAGTLVRLGLHVRAPGGRYAWGRWRAPRVLGRGGNDRFAPAAAPAADSSTEGLRRALHGSSVLLVILDAAGAGHFGAYGYGRPTTPEIDRIAAEGVVFEQAYTPAVYTLGAMASVWTSQYPDQHHNGVPYDAMLPRDRLTLAEVLSARGVTTAGFVANGMAGPAFGLDRGFQEFHLVFRDHGDRAPAMVAALQPWLLAHRDRPFFAYAHFREPHFPYDPAPPFDTRFGADAPLDATARRESAWYESVNRGEHKATPAELAHLGRLYDGNLALADEQIGILRRALESAGLWDRLLVVIAADHGEALGEHGRIGHNGQIYEESVHIPLVLHFPRGAAVAPRRLSGFVDLLDLAPTVAEVFEVGGAGGSATEFKGRSLLALLAGGAGKPAAFSRTVGDKPTYGLRTRDLAYFFDVRYGQEDLYALDRDPREDRNRVEADPIRAAWCRQALQSWALGLRRGKALSAEKARLSPEEIENLKALGYVH